MTLDVYVPVEGSGAATIVLPKSAIVGTILPAGVVRIDYEGNSHGHLGTYAFRLLHAADRHVSGYPTTARAYVQPDELILVGRYDIEERTLALEDFDALADWLGIEPCRCVYPDKCFCPPEAKVASR